jgi:hypothetical protein
VTSEYEIIDAKNAPKPYAGLLGPRGGLTGALRDMEPGKALFKAAKEGQSLVGLQSNLMSLTRRVKESGIRWSSRQDPAKNGVWMVKEKRGE